MLTPTVTCLRYNGGPTKAQQLIVEREVAKLNGTTLGMKPLVSPR